MFHAVCASAAELLPDANTDPAVSAAWLKAYRGPEHTHVRNQCRNAGLMVRFPPEIRNFAQNIVQIQSHRNQADYNPRSNFSLTDVWEIIDDAERAINQLSSASAAIRQAFAITVLLRNRAD